MGVIVLLGRSLVDPVPADPARPFDIVGAVLSAVGLVVLVGGILAADQNLVLMAVLLLAGGPVPARVFSPVPPPPRAGEGGRPSPRPLRHPPPHPAPATPNAP